MASNLLRKGSADILVTVCVASVRADGLGALLASLSGQSYMNWQLIVVSQGRSDEVDALVRAARETDPRITLGHLTERGKTAALNLAVTMSEGEILAFTDDDCVADPRWIETIVKEFTNTPALSVLGGEVIPPRKRFRLSISSCPSAHMLDQTYRPSASEYRAPEGFYMIGANMSFRRSALTEIGFFDPYLGPGTEFPSAEDVDYLIRAELGDHLMRTSSQSIVIHEGGRRTGLRQVVKHHRIYAVGQGALLAKLQLMHHRLGVEWDRDPRSVGAAIREHWRRPSLLIQLLLVRGPRRKAYAEYLAKYQILGTDPPDQITCMR